MVCFQYTFFRNDGNRYGGCKGCYAWCVSPGYQAYVRYRRFRCAVSAVPDDSDCRSWYIVRCNTGDTVRFSCIDNDNADGGFWHKKIYENQMWLDGLYMGQPFYAEYAYRNNRVNDYADIINQFVTVARHNYDPKTDLYRHACDVSKREKWADKTTGLSQHCWGRAMGWYAMACVDVLDFIPEHEAGRESVIEILNKLVAQIKRTQDPATGVWYQVIDRSGDEGNYLESSCSTMFVYTLLKALRKGYICPSYMEVAKKGYEGLLTQFIEVDNKGVVSITKGCAVAGLGGKPVYRTGDYNYYITEKIRSNDAKAVGPFIMASLEWERLFQKNNCGTACK